MDDSKKAPKMESRMHIYKAIFPLLLLSSIFLPACYHKEGRICRAIEKGNILSLRNEISDGVNIQNIECMRYGLVGYPALFLAIDKGRVDIVKCLLENGASLDVSHDGLKPIHAAAFDGNIDIIKLLYDHGADINAKDMAGYGTTPLFFAIGSGNLEAVKFLLALGANPNIRTQNGRNALWLAIPKSCQRDETKFLMFQILLQYGAKTDLVDTDGQTLMDLAKERNRDDIIYLLNQKVHGQESPKM